MCTGMLVSALINLSNPFNKAPPPASIIPFSIISAASSGGVFSNVVLIDSMIAYTGSFKASLTCSSVIVTTFGSPVIISRPLISNDSFSSSILYAEPNCIFISSAVLSPIIKLNSFLT